MVNLFTDCASAYYFASVPNCWKSACCNSIWTFFTAITYHRIFFFFSASLLVYSVFMIRSVYTKYTLSRESSFMSTKFIFVLFIFTFNFHLSFFYTFFGSNNMQLYNLVSLVNPDEWFFKCLSFSRISEWMWLILAQLRAMLFQSFYTRIPFFCHCFLFSIANKQQLWSHDIVISNWMLVFLMHMHIYIHTGRKTWRIEHSNPKHRFD